MLKSDSKIIPCFFILRMSRYPSYTNCTFLHLCFWIGLKARCTWFGGLILTQTNFGSCPRCLTSGQKWPENHHLFLLTKFQSQSQILAMVFLHVCFKSWTRELWLVYFCKEKRCFAFAMKSKIVNEAFVDFEPFAIGNKFPHHINIQWPNGYGLDRGELLQKRPNFENSNFEWIRTKWEYPILKSFLS